MNNGGFDGLQASDTNDGRGGWFVISFDNTGTGGTIEAFAICGGADRAVVARVDRSARERLRRKMEREIANLEARR